MKTDTSKSTILVISMGFLVLYLVFAGKWAIYVSVIIGIAGILSPFLAKKIEWIWMRLSKLLGYIVPNILLTMLYFLFLFPISILSRLVRKDPLMLSKNYKTYFVDIDRKINKSSFEKTW